jgi:hypothetical protein
MVLTNIRELLSDAGQAWATWLSSALEDVQAQRQGFRAGLDKLRSDLVSVAKQIRLEYGKGGSFDAFSQACTARLIKDLAQRAKVPVDFDSGPLLNSSRSIRMYTGGLSSLLYEQGFCGRSPKDSDSRDMLHAVSAAAVADVMVTDDGPLRKVLARVRPSVFKVTDLPTFSRQILG